MIKKFLFLFFIFATIVFLSCNFTSAQDQICPRGQVYDSFKKKCMSCESYGMVWEDYSPPSKTPPYGFCDCGPCQEESSDGCRWCRDFGLPCKDGKCVRTSATDGYFEYSRDIYKGFASSLSEIQERISYWRMTDIIIQPGEFLDRTYCYCECSNPKGVYIWAHQNGPDAKNIAAKVSVLAKKECGGCLRQPVVEFDKRVYENQDD